MSVQSMVLAFTRTTNHGAQPRLMMVEGTWVTIGDIAAEGALSKRKAARRLTITTVSSHSSFWRGLMRSARGIGVGHLMEVAVLGVVRKTQFIHGIIVPGVNVEEIVPFQVGIDLKLNGQITFHVTKEVLELTSLFS